MNNLLTIILTVITSTAFMSFVQFMISRRDKKKQDNSIEREVLRYLMFYIIQDIAGKVIAKQVITLEEKQMLNKMHKLYHEGLGGNGDAKLIMEIVDSLPLKT